MPPRHPRRERSQRRKWELWARMSSGNFATLGSFKCRKSTTWDRRLYFPSEGRHAEDFFALKIRLRPVLEASTLPLDHRSRYIYIYIYMSTYMYNILFLGFTAFKKICSSKYPSCSKEPTWYLCRLRQTQSTTYHFSLLKCNVILH